ncbi:MAG: anaerobic sulfatase maturase [Kiritimatiellia bacterium]
MQPFSLLIKPAGADCNLRCHYCFYLGRKELYPNVPIHRMSVATLTRLVRSYLALPFPVHTFAFQGGEPLLMGEAFFRTLVELQRRYARPGACITNSVQTNGTLLTASLAEFFAQEKFLLGVSVDGAAEVHDVHRLASNGTGSHEAVMRGIALLNAADAPYNLLTLVSQSNVHHPVETYRYLRDTLGCRFMQFIECVEFDSQGERLPYAITPEAWAEFVIALFDEWIAHDLQSVSVRFFDSIISKLVLGEAHSCAMGCDCRAYLVVEHNGDVYPCDFFVRSELLLGNLHENDWEELWDSPLHTVFGERKSRYSADCVSCPFLMFCQGDCPKNRTGHDPAADSRQRSYLCSAWKQIYAHLLPPLRKVAREVHATAERSRRTHA